MITSENLIDFKISFCEKMIELEYESITRMEIKLKMEETSVEELTKEFPAAKEKLEKERQDRVTQYKAGIAECEKSIEGIKAQIEEYKKLKK